MRTIHTFIAVLALGLLCIFPPRLFSCGTFHHDDFGYIPRSWSRLAQWGKIEDSQWNGSISPFIQLSIFQFLWTHPHPFDSRFLSLWRPHTHTHTHLIPLTTSIQRKKPAFLTHNVIWVILMTRSLSASLANLAPHPLHQNRIKLQWMMIQLMMTMPTRTD